jgi:hypothetical protein
MKIGFGLALAAALAVSIPVAEAAVGTTCLCRSDDGKAFYKNTVRHHRWACDYALGYVKSALNNKGGLRPTTQTCNKEEIYQYKVFRCVSAGCTYPQARSTNAPNTDLEKIEPMTGKRLP